MVGRTQRATTFNRSMTMTPKNEDSVLSSSVLKDGETPTPKATDK